jgi:hypothetical protein
MEKKMVWVKHFDYVGTVLYAAGLTVLLLGPEGGWEVSLDIRRGFILHYYRSSAALLVLSVGKYSCLFESHRSRYHFFAIVFGSYRQS